jgi:hypothetical protein
MVVKDGGFYAPNVIVDAGYCICRPDPNISSAESAIIYHMNRNRKEAPSGKSCRMQSLDSPNGSDSITGPGRRKRNSGFLKKLTGLEPGCTPSSNGIGVGVEDAKNNHDQTPDQRGSC